MNICAARLGPQTSSAVPMGTRLLHLVSLRLTLAFNPVLGHCQLERCSPPYLRAAAHVGTPLAEQPTQKELRLLGACKYFLHSPKPIGCNSCCLNRKVPPDLDGKAPHHCHPSPRLFQSTIPVRKYNPSSAFLKKNMATVHCVGSSAAFAAMEWFASKAAFTASSCDIFNGT